MESKQARILYVCKIKEGADADDFIRLIEFQEPESKEGKCLMACVNEMNKDVRITMKSTK